jgi:predicted permease
VTELINQIDQIWQDLRFAARQLVRAPGFAVTAMLTLALGIGANTGIYSIINGFLRPLPVPDADRIVVLAADVPGDETGLRYQFSYPALVDYREQSGVFSDLFGFETQLGGLTLDGKTSQFLFQAVTGNLFSGLGVTPAAGRLLQPGEGEYLGGEPVVVLGYAYWQKRFSGRPDAVGSVVRIDGQPVRVIGVTPEGFHGMYSSTTMDGYVPLVNLQWHSRKVDWLFTDRASTYLTAVGRLKPGVSLAAAQSAVSVVAQRLAEQYPVTERGTAIRVLPEPLARPVPLSFMTNILPVIRGLLFLLATLVLLLACLNVTNLLFVRGTARERELAVRSALGSGRARLVRLLLAESLLITLGGAIAGVALGQMAGPLILRTVDIAIDIPIRFDSALDWRVFRYAFLVVALTGLAIGIVPAWRASRTRMTDVLHDGGRGGTESVRRQRMRRVLVIAQVAGSLVLLIVAGFFVRSLQRTQKIDLGFDPNQLITMRLNPYQVGYELERATAFYDELQRRVRALPGVEYASLSFNTPMSYIVGACPVMAEGAPVTDERTWPAVPYNTVGTDYFKTLKLQVVRGRAFDERDAKSTTPVIMVNETLAAQFWPGRDPIGQRLRVRCVTQEELWEVVGVARDSKYIAVFEKQLPFVYVAADQTQPMMRVLQVRSAVPPDQMFQRVQREIDTLDPEMPVADRRTMRDIIGGSFGHVLFRVGATQATSLGLLGLVLAVVGVYGVASYSASQRVREIGIRLALGAEPSHVRWLVLRQSAGLVIVGVVVGLVASAVVTTLFTRFVVLVSATDPVTFVSVTATLVAIALVACYLPARRAMRVDPMSALRHE